MFTRENKYSGVNNVKNYRVCGNIQFEDTQCSPTDCEESYFFFYTYVRILMCVCLVGVQPRIDPVNQSYSLSVLPWIMDFTCSCFPSVFKPSFVCRPCWIVTVSFPLSFVVLLPPLCFFISFFTPRILCQTTRQHLDNTSIVADFCH